MDNSGFSILDDLANRDRDKLSSENTLEVGLKKANSEAYDYLIQFLSEIDEPTQAQFEIFVRYLNNNIPALQRAVNVLFEYILSDKPVEELRNTCKSIEVDAIRNHTLWLMSEHYSLSPIDDNKEKLHMLFWEFYRELFAEARRIMWRNKVTDALRPVVFGI